MVSPESVFQQVEADRFGDFLETHQASLYGSLTVFPIHGITPEGTCACPKGAACKAKPGKHPAVLGWSDLPPGTKMPRRDDGAGVGIGLVTGSTSGGIIVLDLDVREGVDGREGLRELESVYGRLPKTMTVESPTGGLHLYFQTPRRLKTLGGPKAHARLAEGIDLKGEGGMVVLPGSPHARGGVYRVSILAPIAPLPDTWADFLPSAGDRRKGRPPAEKLVTDSAEVRQRLTDHVKGRHGQEAACWRRALAGERMFRIVNGPGDPTLPLVQGVDVFMSQGLLWSLAASTDWDWFRLPGIEIAEILRPSLWFLDQDARGSKWTAEHVAYTWDRACEKIAPERERAEDLAEALTKQALENANRLLPLAVQFGRRFAVLDDRGAPKYVLDSDPAEVVSRARHLWEGKDRPLEVPTRGGSRPMTAAEFGDQYSQPGCDLVYEYVATAPRFEDMTLILPYRRRYEVTPRHDPEAAQWLDLLDPSGRLVHWIAWASPERAHTTIPALTLVGAPHVGKTVLACALARAAGARTYCTLSAALARFGEPLLDCPIVFSDEGLPSQNGRPMTEEFRTFVTANEHSIERKGVNGRVALRGAPRVILAANRMSRLFAAAGLLGRHDVSGLLRRLLVVDLEDEARAREAHRIVDGMGTSATDPARLERLAGHFRWIQEIPTLRPAPEPYEGNAGKGLRLGSDATATALEVLDDAYGTVDWIVIAGDLVWVRMDAWAMRASMTAPAIYRATDSYLQDRAQRLRTHPVTGATLGSRARWSSLRLADLKRDGFLNDPT